LLVGGVAVVLLLGVFFYFHSQSEVASQLTLERQQAEERLKSEEEKARLAEQRAQEEAESRKKIELEFAQKLDAAEAARKEAEAKALAQTAARLANARGTLVVTTNPAGASVAVGDFPPRSSPATFSDIKIGTYPVVITLPRHEEVKLDLVVAENGTTNPGLINLVPLVGALRITSGPGEADYELHPAKALMVAPESRRTGKTPATLDDLSPGEYSVTLTRDGWAPHSQIVSIARGATTYLRWEWPNGVVNITSSPPGATIMQAGTSLGTTPLTLTDQPPGETRYDVTLENYDSIPLVAKVEGGRTLDLQAEFDPQDRIFSIDEVDRKPAPIGVKQPELPYYLTLENGHVDLELTVNRDGTTRNLSVVQTSNPEIGQYCLAAVAKWQFKPALKAGVPVNVRLKLPFTFKAVKS
jgi:TonB family protein